MKKETSIINPQITADGATLRAFPSVYSPKFKSIPAD